MVEGKVEIFLSYKEPEYKDNLMWLRPYLDREGFELLYWGAKGWTVFVPCCHCNNINNDNSDDEKDNSDDNLDDNIEDNESNTDPKEPDLNDCPSDDKPVEKPIEETSTNIPRISIPTVKPCGCSKNK